MAETPVGGVLDALAAHGCPPRRAGGGWQAKCPGHDDRSPSLSIAEGSDGRVLLTCFAGCAFLDVLAALGLDVRDVFPRPVERRLRPRGRVSTVAASPPPVTRRKHEAVVGLSGNAFLDALDDLGIAYVDGTAPGVALSPESYWPGGCAWEPGRVVEDAPDRSGDRLAAFAHLCAQVAERELDRQVAARWLAAVGLRAGLDRVDVLDALEATIGTVAA